MTVTRRDLLEQSLLAGALTGAGLAGTVPTAAAEARVSSRRHDWSSGRVQVGKLAFPDLAAELEALIRVECNLAPVDSPVWFRWTAYAVTPEIAPTPVVAFEGLELSRVVRRSDGSYFARGIDLSFPRDHASGEFTSTAKHPVTGATIEVPVSVLGGNVDPGYIISPQVGWWPLRAATPATVDLHCHWWQEGDVGRLRRERTAPPGWPKTFIEGGYYEFPMAEFRDPRVTAVPYRVGGIYVFPFPKWLDMGDRPGQMVGMISGRKLASVEQLPEEFLRRAEKEHPELLSLDSLFKEIPQP